MSDPEQVLSRDWLAIIQKNIIPIILAVVIIGESSVLALTAFSLIQTQLSSNSMIQELQEVITSLFQRISDDRKLHCFLLL